MPNRNSSIELEAMRAELALAAGEISRLRSACDDLTAQVTRLSSLALSARLEADVTRSKIDVGAELLHAFWQYRRSEEYARIYTDPHPRVSVCIATHNRAGLLMERCLPSVLAQDYPNFEVVIVGDGCTDLTGERMKALHDQRVRFVNRPQTRELPIDPIARWSVAGADAGNHALELAGGQLLTHLDDDDEYLPGRLGKLVRHLQFTRAEFVFHPFESQSPDGAWNTNRADSFQHGALTTGAVLELAWFKRLPWNPMAYLYQEPGDWNRFRRIKYLGARIEKFPGVLLRHYAESKPAENATKAPTETDQLNLSQVVTEGFARPPHLVQGLWPDGWVGEEFAFTVVSPDPSMLIELCVEIPQQLEQGLQLDIVNGDRPANAEFPSASIGTFRLPFPAGAGEAARIQLRARGTWCPMETGDAPDPRRLAFRLLSLKLVPHAEAPTAG